jgi:peptidoglycan/LPS O-acetylase OafA/YrhL
MISKTVEQQPATDRDRVLDTLRVGAILYIVGFWHLFDYIQPSRLHKTAVTELLTYGVLGLFCFISGYLLANRYELQSRKDVVRFYWRRVIRLYPMYLITLIGFLMFGLIEQDMFFKTALATNMIWFASLPTLWFVALILTFYAIAPLYLLRYSVSKTVGITIILYVLLLVPILFKLPYIDYRFPLFLPAFAFGIYAGRHPQVRCWFQSPGMLGAALLSFLVAVGLFKQNLGAGVGWFLVIDLAIIASIPCLWRVGDCISPVMPARLLSFLSYSSFAVYLLHRLIFRLGLWVYQPPTVYGSLIYLVGIMLPVTIAVAYLFQTLYDQVLMIRCSVARLLGVFHRMMD